MKSHVTVNVLKTVSVLLMLFTVGIYLALSYVVYFMDMELKLKIWWLVVVLVGGILGIVLECMVYAFAYLVDVVDRTARHYLQKSTLEMHKERLRVG